jgi:hypothetical protein
MNEIVVIRGGGDLASGVALRLHRTQMRVVITELAQPLVIRRTGCYHRISPTFSHSKNCLIC